MARIRIQDLERPLKDDELDVISGGLTSTTLSTSTSLSLTSPTSPLQFGSVRFGGWLGGYNASWNCNAVAGVRG